MASSHGVNGQNRKNSLECSVGRPKTQVTSPATQAVPCVPLCPPETFTWNYGGIINWIRGKKNFNVFVNGQNGSKQPKCN